MVTMTMKNLNLQEIKGEVTARLKYLVYTPADGMVLDKEPLHKFIDLGYVEHRLGVIKISVAHLTLSDAVKLSLQCLFSLLGYINTSYRIKINSHELSEGVVKGHNHHHLIPTLASVLKNKYEASGCVVMCNSVPDGKFMVYEDKVGDVVVIK